MLRGDRGTCHAGPKRSGTVLDLYTYVMQSQRDQVHNRFCPEKSLASSHCHEAAARFSFWKRQPDHISALPRCYLGGSRKTYRPTPEIIKDLKNLGALEGLDDLDK